MKKYLIGFLVGIVISSSIVLAATKIDASNIIYMNSNNEEKTVDIVLNDLYAKANRELILSNPIYSETLSTISSNSRQQAINLSTGKWIVTFIRNSSWNRSSATNSTGSSNYAMLCNSGSSVTMLTGKNYQKSSTSAANGNYITSRLYENMYLVNVTNSNDTCYVEYKDVSSNDNPEVVTMQAIKIDYE